MHKMERTPKIITIIGLVFEGISGFVLLMTGLFFQNIEKIPGYTESLTEMSPDELELYEFIMGIAQNVVYIMGIVIIVLFVINLYLFTRLMREKLTNEVAHKVYLYQAIWGGINLLFNQITGILYLISGVQGFNNQKDNVKTRDGI
ncbi:MAG: hypothetical protein JXR62_02145 [Bacilli bacterium]|nr:hypothetical protein [Bacilli bacterium]